MIPSFDLAAQQLVIKRQIDDNISKVLEHGKYILGPEVAELEERLCEYTGAKHCITCANGTDALQIALMAIGVGSGDEVIMPSFSYIAPAEAVTLLGAKPVYVDIDPVTFNINPALIEEKITAATKAIIPVSLYGQPADFQKINKIACKHNLIVIEDGAQSFGAEQRGQKSCNLSDIGCTSFFPTKPLGCYGDGGAIFTSNEKLALKLKMIARHGQSKRYKHDIVGVNSRLDTLQAAILLAKLHILDDERYIKEQLAQFYIQRLSSIADLEVPVVSEGSQSAWAQFTIQISDRNKFQNYLTHFEIPSTVHYPIPLHRQLSVVDLSANAPISEKACERVLSIPMHAYMKQNTQAKIMETFEAWFSGT